MKGIGADAHLIVDWPVGAASPDPQEMLPASLTWITEELKKLADAQELSAYKGDKNAPRFATNG